MKTKIQKNKQKIKRASPKAVKQKVSLSKKRVAKKVELLKPRLVGLESLRPAPGTRKKPKLLGRGPGSGHGKTATRGNKGQSSRAGRDFYLGFEGAQIPLIKRIPKRGFSNLKFQKKYQLINLKQLHKIKEARLIDPQYLLENGLVKRGRGLIKILGKGNISVALEIKAHAFSRSAKEKIEKVGGKIAIIDVNA